MEKEIQQIAAEKGIEFLDEKGLLEKNTILGFALLLNYTEGFEKGVDFNGTEEEMEKASADFSLEKFKNDKAIKDIKKEEPLIALLISMTIAMGFKEGYKYINQIEIHSDLPDELKLKNDD